MIQIDEILTDERQVVRREFELGEVQFFIQIEPPMHVSRLLRCSPSFPTGRGAADPALLEQTPQQISASLAICLTS